MDNNNTNAQQPLDQSVVNLTKAIRYKESGGDFTAKGASGEYGAYQYTKPTWEADSKKYLGQVVPLEQATPEQQNAVMYNKIKQLKDSGKDVAQIAAIHNHGNDEGGNWTKIIGKNSKGVSYNVPEYVNGVVEAYNKYKQGIDPASPAAGTMKQGLNQALSGQGEGGTVGGIGKIAGGAMDTLVKPFEDLAAIPMQTLVALANKTGLSKKLLGKDIKDPYATEGIPSFSGNQQLNSITTGGGLLGKLGSATKVAATTATAYGAGGLYNMATGAKALADPVVKTAMSKFNMPMAEFQSLNNTEKLNALGEALKTAEAGDALKIAKAMDVLKPGSGILSKILKGGLADVKGYLMIKVLGDTIGGIAHTVTGK